MCQVKWEKDHYDSLILSFSLIIKIFLLPFLGSILIKNEVVIRDNSLIQTQDYFLINFGLFKFIFEQLSLRETIDKSCYRKIPMKVARLWCII